MHLRLFLTQLFNQLSDADRILLHSNVGAVVPYQDQIDSTPTGSRRLLYSLFDRNVISEENVDYLTELFGKIHLSGAGEKLKSLFISIAPLLF